MFCACQNADFVEGEDTEVWHHIDIQAQSRKTHKILWETNLQTLQTEATSQPIQISFEVSCNS